MTPLQNKLAVLEKSADNLAMACLWLQTYAKALNLKNLKPGWVVQEEPEIRKFLSDYLKESQYTICRLNEIFNEYRALIKEDTKEEE